NIADGDILCVKGIFESNLPKFINYILSLAGISIVDYRTELPNRFDALLGLNYLNYDDIYELRKSLVNLKSLEPEFYIILNKIATNGKVFEYLIERYENSVALYALTVMNIEPVLTLCYLPANVSDSFLFHVMRRLSQFNIATDD
ncbi:MAG: hypothetical protein HOP02_15475, partial [Methylococcaceae bacterium]|nr:hypothetical protein [Methylococcaceae bacterium]